MKISIQFKIWKRQCFYFLSSPMPLLPQLPYLNGRLAKICTKIVNPSPTSNTEVVTEFLINKCGLTHEEIAKAFKHCNRFLAAKSTQNLEKVLELLIGCGLTTPALIRRVVFYSPQILTCSERNLNSKLEFLRSFVREEDISKLILRDASIFTCSENRHKSAISLLQRLGVEGRALSDLVVGVPRLLAIAEEKVIESFEQAEGLGIKKGSKRFAVALRVILGLGKENLDRRLRCLSCLGFSEKQITEMSRQNPWVMGFEEENLKRHMDFLVKVAGFTLTDIFKNPSLLGYSLEKRIIPRYRVIEALKSMQVLNTDMIGVRMFQITEKCFLDRYVNKNAECSVLLDIYHCAKAGKPRID